MSIIKKSLVLIVTVLYLCECDCARAGGYRGGGGRPRTTSRPRYTQGTTSRYHSTTSHYSGGATTPRSRFSSTTRRMSTTTANWNNLPPRPGQTQSYQTGNQAPQNVKIVNKYNYHYPGYYSMPVQSSHPGYFYTPSSYHYSSSDTGSTALGFFLGYSLAKLTTPTFSHQSFYDGYRPRYDHYEVHHYYHNKEAVPQTQEIKSNSIIGCVGDSVTICPANTTSLCTSSGALMCVVAATSTVPCMANNQVNCVKSTISCVNNTAPECQSGDKATINIPCVSNAQVYGDVKIVNRSILASGGTADNNNGTVTTTPEPLTSTKYPITTTPSASSTASTRRKREVPQNFCVTVLALPAPKKSTEGELVYNDVQAVLSNFFEAAWNL